MLTELGSAIPDMNQRYQAISKFPASEQFRAVSGARISALFWATISIKLGLAQAESFPKGSMYNDIDVVAMYSPFCEAMFVDKEIAHLTKQGELREELGGRTHSPCANVRKTNSWIISTALNAALQQNT